MHYLEAMELMFHIRELIQTQTRVQVTKAKVQEMRVTISQIMILLQKEIKEDAQLNLAFTSIFQVLDVLDKADFDILPDSMKNTIESGMTRLETEIAILAYHFFEKNEFEPTEEIIPLMREVVRLKMEGESDA